MERERLVSERFDFSTVVYLGLFTNLFLLISSYWFSYSNFYLEVVVVSVVLLFGLYFKFFEKFCLVVGTLFYLYFLYYNFNYIFIFLITFILGLLIINFLDENLRVPIFVFSLIPLLILGHLIWFNILPFGFDDNYRLDLGSLKDDSVYAELYINDSFDVLSPPQSYDDDTWREFERDGTFYVNFNTPVMLKNKSVKVTLRYDAIGPIYVNGELFYDPAWGSVVKYVNDEEVYIYGAKRFNLTFLNTSLDNDFETVEDYLKSSFPNGVLMKDFTGMYLDIENEMNLKYINFINSVSYYDGFSSEPKTIYADFRGPINFYGVFKDSIDISLLKQDLNLYNGSDSINVTIKDFDDKIIAKKRISDNDRIVNRTTVESIWVDYSFSVPLEREGVYRVEFEYDEMSKDPDFVMSNITINSNKLMIDGDFYLWSPGTLYNSYVNNSVMVRYWWEDYDQIVKFENRSVFDLDKDLREVWVNLNLSDNEYINFEKGKLVVKPVSDLAVFEDTNINTELVREIVITKSLELDQENINFFNISGLNITSTKGTKIYRLDVEIG